MGRRVIIDELEFEVPYGKLAAKSWHEETEDSKRILALHGWMDNAGSFDNLMPLLKKKNEDLYIVALDLPGHGKSSQIPPGSSYSDLNIIMEIRRCLRELTWTQPIKRNLLNGDGFRNHMFDSSSSSNSSNNSLSSSAKDEDEGSKKFTIIGHSLGAGLGLYYASLFPDDVDEVILLDFMKPRTITPKQLLLNTAETIDQFISSVQSQSPYSSPKSNRTTQNKTSDKGQVIVSQETAIIATIEAHKNLGFLTRDDAACLLKRSTVAVSTPPNSVIYSRDLRLQSMLSMRDNWEINKLIFSGLKCHVISILSKRGLYAVDECFKDKMDAMEEFLRSTAASYHIQWLETDHFLHINKPKETAYIINKFLECPEGYETQDDSSIEAGL